MANYTDSMDLFRVYILNHSEQSWREIEKLAGEIADNGGTIKSSHRKRMAQICEGIYDCYRYDCGLGRIGCNQRKTVALDVLKDEVNETIRYRARHAS